MELADKER
jgi:hypothetical protein